MSEKNNAIFTRRSIRKYEITPIPKEIIEEVIKAAQAAPSAKNRQPWKYLVYSGNAKKEILDIFRQGIAREEKNPMLPFSSFGIPDAKNTLNIMENAPVVIMVINTNGKSPFSSLNDDERFTEINDSMSIGASIENMLICAEEIGIGSLWIGNTCFAYKELVDYLKINDCGQLIGAVALGYKAQNPSARPRKNIEEIVEYYN
jgi:nitroreductase